MYEIDLSKNTMTALVNTTLKKIETYENDLEMQIVKRLQYENDPGNTIDDGSHLF